MARQKVREITPASDIRPVASPVNTYVRPADPAPSPLNDLAKGLAGLDSGLSAFMDQRQAKADEEAALRGKAEFYKNNQQGYAEAVRQGLIPPNASKPFIQSWKKEQGNLAGIKLREEFNTAYLGWEGRNSNDPAAFQDFLSTFIAERVTTEDVDVLRGLTPHLDALVTAGSDTFSRDSAQYALSGSLNTRAAVAAETIDYAEHGSIANGGEVDLDRLWDDLMAQREEALAAGHRSEEYDKLLVDAIADKAEEYGNEDLLQLLERTTPGSQVKLSSLPEFRDRLAQSTGNISDARIRRMEFEEKQAKKIDEERENAIVRTVTSNLARDPAVEIPEEVMKEWRKYDPKADDTLAKLRKSLNDAVGIEDPRDLMTVEARILEGATPADIMDMVKDGYIKNPATLSKYLDRVEKRQKAMREGQGILTTQSAKRLTKTIRERTMPDDITGMFDPGGTSDEGLEAIRDFEQMLIEFETTNPNATLIEREKAIHEAGEWVLKRINTDERTYESEADRQALLDRQQAEADARTLQSQREQQQGQLGSENVQGSQPQAAEDEQSFWRIPSREEVRDALSLDAGLGGKPRAKSAEEQAAWSRPGDGAPEEQDVRTRTKELIKTLYQNDQPPALDELEPEYRQRLEEEAAKAGMTPEEYNMEIWKRLRQALLGSGSAETTKMAYAPEGAAENAAAQAIEANFNPGAAIDTAVEAADRTTQAIRTAKPILDLVGKTEGTDRGDGYNETLAYGRLTGGDVDLVNMTLGEIDKLQTSMLRHPDNVWNSSAVGRYQIIRTTLRKLKKNLGLTDDMKFTPELQDMLAVELLKGRGYNKWLRGEMSDTAFFNNLSKEWASLPNAKGLGTYEGQRIGTTLEGLKDAVYASRAARLEDETTPTAYSNIPDDEVHQFMEWNSDPIANHEENLNSIDQDLAAVVRRAQEIADVKFVVGSGKRDSWLQKKAVEWGWSKTEDSDHLHGDAVDLWPLDENGAIKFDRKLQVKIVSAMKKAAKELGYELDAGADWKSFKDYPHFALKSRGGAVA